MNQSDFSATTIREISGKLSSNCVHTTSVACLHGTFVAGILSANRNSVAPAICPNCTLLIRPIFAETTTGSEQMPGATPEELAAAIVESIDAGARVLNLSVALAQPSSRGQRELEESLDYAVKHGVLVVAAAGNQGTIGSSVITRHPWVIPVVACDFQGRPIIQSNLGNSIAKQGLSAPGENITRLGVDGQPLTLGGTSVAAPFVTGAVALLWSEFPTATAAEIKLAVTQACTHRRTTVVPPLLDAWKAYRVLAKARS
jgi:subtilisin family serine protease